MTVHDAATARPRVFKGGDYVLYRDPALYWTEQPDHTKVCRVIVRYTTGTVDLLDVAADRVIRGADAAYMRWLAPEDAMRDIDTAPLDDPDTGVMSPAGAAWLRRLARQRVPDQG